MGRGGKRDGAGRKKGGRNQARFALTAEVPDAPAKLTAADRMHAMKRRVALAVADGMLPEKIAALMGFDVVRLRQVFSFELEHGREVIRLEELCRLDAASADGKVSASKAVLGAAGATAPAGESVKNGPGRTNAAALRLLNGGKT